MTRGSASASWVTSHLCHSEQHILPTASLKLASKDKTAPNHLQNGSQPHLPQVTLSQLALLLSVPLLEAPLLAAEGKSGRRRLTCSLDLEASSQEGGTSPHLKAFTLCCFFLCWTAWGSCPGGQGHNHSQRRGNENSCTG